MKSIPRHRAKFLRRVPLLGQHAPGELVLSPIRTRMPVWVPAHNKLRRGLGQSYSPPDYFDVGWASVLVAGAQSIGADPYDVAGLIIGESGFNPGAQGGAPCAGGGYAVGLNQLCPVSQGVFTNQGYSVSDYLALPVSQQLQVGVFPYWQNVMANNGVTSVSGAELYLLNWLPAYFKPGMSSSDTIVDSSSGYYDASLDVGNKGYVTLGDLETRIQNMQANNPDLWSYLSTQIALSGGIFPSTTTTVLGGLALGFLGYFGYQKYKRRTA